MTHHQTNTQKGNLLIVDDIIENLRLLTDILSKQGYIVRPVPNGRVALATAQTKPPDLVLLDIKMPDLDGYQVCEQLKADEKTRDIPVIFLSALSETLDKVKAFGVGGVDYITKPFQVEEVLARVKTHLALRDLQKHLEHKNEDLSNTLEQLKATQDELIQSEKMAALGQLVAGVAHEINTPLGAIQLSVDNISVFLNQTLTKLPAFFRSLSETQEQDFFALLQQALQNETILSSREQRRLRRTLVHQLEEQGIDNATKMADHLVEIGAYENIEQFFPLLSDKTILEMAYQLVSLQQSTETIATSSQRAAKVVFALKNFAHFDHSGEKVLTNVTEGIETILTLYHNQLKHGIHLKRVYDSNVPPILCYPDALNQIWTNLIQNALHAMNYQGTLTIAVKQQDNQVQIYITDTGLGIPPEIQQKIFEPFFTTKAHGEGSGLGLDIIKKIIEKHEGQIKVESVEGQTTFAVFLPIQK